MRTTLHRFENGQWTGIALPKASVVFVFWEGIVNPLYYSSLRERYPYACIVGCSTAGNVLETSISDNDAVAVVMALEKSAVRLVKKEVTCIDDSFQVAQELALALKDDNLRHIFVLSDGLKVNGTQLAKGFNHALDYAIPVSGGLAGDGANFHATSIIADSDACEGEVVALGFYGDITIKASSYAGWNEFGVERIVTKSQGNIVYEIDNEPALELYKRYLGSQAAELPLSGLKFPLSVWKNREQTPIIRTLLAVSEEEQSLIFAGEIEEGDFCRLMKTNIDLLVDNAEKAAQASKIPALSVALVISCIGRRLVMGQMAEEELEIMKECYGDETLMTGFYSYGELAPMKETLACELHNQTMTVTVFSE